MSEIKDSPLVSIIIPVYNGSNYLREAVDSALAQTYENKEIIIVNDGSRDGGATEEIALSYGDRVRYFKKENGGVSSALNMGIANMRGEYFSWLSHDDRYTPHKLQVIMELLGGYEDKSLIGLCESTQIDKDSKPLSDIKARVRFETGRVIDWKEALADLLRYGSFNGCTLIIPKCVFDECGGFHEGLRYAQDWLMWLNIFLRGYSLVYTDAPFVEGRVHNGQLTQTGISLFHKDSETVGELLLPLLIEKSTAEENFLYLFARNNGIYKNTSVVRKCVKEGREAGLISPSLRVKLWVISIYGRVRPLIRRIYYRLAKGVKTK